MTTYHLAQVNFARLIAPHDDPRLKDFMAQLDPINALAEGAPGFVWRLKSDAGNATDIQISDDPLFIVNYSVWENVEALFDFAYKHPEHVAMFRRRLEFFEKHTDVYLVMWWIPAGTIPTIEQAFERLAHLRKHGATPYAFHFKQRYPQPESEPQPITD